MKILKNKKLDGEIINVDDLGKLLYKKINFKNL